LRRRRRRRIEFAIPQRIYRQWINTIGGGEGGREERFKHILNETMKSHKEFYPVHGMPDYIKTSLSTRLLRTKSHGRSKFYMVLKSYRGKIFLQVQFLVVFASLA
jgi:hypothetical protein